jgi:uncharacterized protein (DUF1697 family)
VTYVALLRGVNVGGKNVIKMAALAGCLKAARLENVRTCIQSGNVIFEASTGSARTLATRIEHAVSDRFGIESRAVVLSRNQLKAVLTKAPPAWSRGSGLRCNIAFLRPPLESAEALEHVKVTPGVDSVASGPGVLYLSTVISRLESSAFARLVGTPVYAEMTVRNYNTSRKILEMMEA